MRKGLLFIISGPAGSGKGTVVNELLQSHPELKLSISATTRNPRPGEIDGTHYYFITKEEFEQRISNGKMLEYTTYGTNYYGTPLKEVEEAMNNGIDVVLEIEVDGGMQVKKKLPESAVTVMLTPPDREVLEARLRGRGTEEESVIANRLAIAEREIKCCLMYDYIVINKQGGAEECASDIVAAVRAENFKPANMYGSVSEFFN